MATGFYKDVVAMLNKSVKPADIQRRLDITPWQFDCAVRRARAAGLLPPRGAPGATAEVIAEDLSASPCGGKRHEWPELPANAFADVKFATRVA
jgi:hypothetical protein